MVSFEELEECERCHRLTDRLVRWFITEYDEQYICETCCRELEKQDYYYWEEDFPPCDRC